MIENTGSSSFEKHLSRINIILDGCDKTGKTTIANEILKRFPHFKLIHCINPKSQEDGKQQYLQIVKDLNSKTGLLYDRALLGECVYAPILRKYYPNYMRSLEKQIGENTLLVLVVATEERVLSRFDGNFITKEQLPIILSRFLIEFDKCKIKNKLIIDTTTDSIAQSVDKILKVCYEIKEKAHTNL